MGTRGFVTFFADGDEKTAYNQWDSHPSSLGLSVLNWLRLAATDPHALREKVRALRMVQDDAELSSAERERLAEVDGNASPAGLFAAGVICDARDFPRDSLFAEWGYVIDLDAGAFEVYRGFRTVPHDKGRFADRPPISRPSVITYYPVARVRSWDLEHLPAEPDFLAAFGEGE